MIIHIGAILFGVSDEIAKITLNEGCSIEKRSIYDKKITRFFDENILQLQKNYTNAIDFNNDTFWWIKAEYNIKKGCYVEDITELEYITCLDKKVRMLRLSLGKYVYVKDFRYVIDIDEHETVCGNVNSTDLAMEEIINTDFVIKNVNEVEKLLKVDIPFKNEWIYKIFLVYEKSFSKDIEISFVVIFVALEMIFLNNDNHKREKLSRRIAKYLTDDCDKQDKIYNNIKQLYKKRGNFVHEGKNTKITNEEVEFLRSIVRNIIIQNVESEKIKKDFCND